jgi:aspartyl-tRNA(Asn)/glutamyl-tRNA(Gln) amidotransferase subunit A
MIKEKLQRIKAGELTAVGNIQQFLKTIEEKDKKINAFLCINKHAVKDAEEVDKKIKKGKAGKLAGLAIAVKSNINVKGLHITCASKTLENYEGTYDADVIEKIKAEDGIIIGMTNMDEFASGSSGESSAYGITDNPAASGRIPGGSSSGSSAAVAAGMCDIALGTDTGGSIRNPASHCGVIGIKPSYGRVSRYGLIDLSMSLDQIGPLCKDVYGCALMMEIIAGKSEYDTITYDEPVKSYARFSAPQVRIGMSADFEKLCTDKKIYEKIKEAAGRLAKKLGAEIRPVNLKYVDLAIQTYYPLVYVEFFSGTRKFDGRRYGHKIEDVCGEEVLRRILGGEEISRAEYHGRYYRKALQVKKLIKKDFENAFNEVDIIITPTTPVLPHKLGTKIEDPKVMYAYDAFTIPANLAEICAGVIKAGEIDGIPVGMQIMAPAFKEDVMFNVLKAMEDIS